MLFRHFTQIVCWILIVNCTMKNVQTISFDDIFEYLLDGIDDSDESSSSEELTTTNLNVTCKNCNLTVECHNCTKSDKDTQSTIPIQLSSQYNPHFASSPLPPTPTIPAPERVVEILSSNNISPESVATGSQNSQPSMTSAVTGGVSTDTKTEEQSEPNTKAIANADQIITDQANTSTDSSLNSSDGATSGNEKPTTP